MTHPKKIAQVKQLTDSLKENQNFILLKYSAASTKILEDLRKKLKGENSRLNIVKNSLFQKALNILSAKNEIYRLLKQKFFPLKQPSAIIYFDQDWSPALKIYHQFTNDLKNFSFKFGFLDGQIFDENQLAKIAQLPPKNELMAKLIGQFNAPSNRFVYALKFNIARFTQILKQKSNQKH